MNNRWKVYMKVVSLEGILNHPMMAALTQTETNKKKLMTILQVRVDFTRLSECLAGSVNFAFILLILLMGARCGHKKLLPNWHLFQRPHEICLETEKDLLASVNFISLHEDSFYFLRFT